MLQREIEEYKKRVYVSRCAVGGVHWSFVPIIVFLFLDVVLLKIQSAIFPGSL